MNELVNVFVCKRVIKAPLLNEGERDLLEVSLFPSFSPIS